MLHGEHVFSQELDRLRPQVGDGGQSASSYCVGFDITVTSGAFRLPCCSARELNDGRLSIHQFGSYWLATVEII